MGPPQAEDMLRECLAMGADEAILVSDRALGGADTWTTSNTISATIKNSGKFDVPMLIEAFTQYPNEKELA